MVCVAPRGSIQGSGDRRPRTTLDRPRGLCGPETRGVFPALAVAGEAERGRACGLERRPHCPGRRRHRDAQPELIRTQHWAIRHRRPAMGPTPGSSRYLAATLEGFVNALDAFEAKFMLPWSFSEEAAIEKHMAQLQHNMWVTNAASYRTDVAEHPESPPWRFFLVGAYRLDYLGFPQCVKFRPPRPRLTFPNVERGETLVITRHGRAIARIVPEAPLRQAELDTATSRSSPSRSRTRRTGQTVRPDARVGDSEHKGIAAARRKDHCRGACLG
jgi:antitoxin (DNA-binding transcriptional repressor) of toxin-antitoxin stability system